MKNGSIQNRRKFLKGSITGMIGATFIPGSFNKAEQKKSIKNGEQKFIYRTLGKTGIKLPIISMGTGDTYNKKLIETAIDMGIVYLATSSYYGEGKNEQLLGEIVKGRKRDSVLLTTNVAPNDVDYKGGLFSEKTDVGLFMKKTEASLKRLGVDYLDIFMLPFAGRRESVFFEPLLKAMQDIKKQGKARFIGIATHSYEPEAIRAAADTKIYDVVLTAINFRKENKDEIKKAIAYAANAGLGIIAMKTMAGVYWDKERKNPINTKASLKWVLQDENIHTAIPGITTFDQLNQNFSIMADLRMTEEEKKDLKLTYNNPEGVYCQQCGTCVPQCPKSMDIPTIMRSYMYAYGYKNLAHAKETLSVLDLSSIGCKSCGSCPVKCNMAFDVKKKILDIARLKDVPSDFLC